MSTPAGRASSSSSFGSLTTSTKRCHLGGADAETIGQQVRGFIARLGLAVARAPPRSHHARSRIRWRSDNARQDPYAGLHAVAERLGAQHAVSSRSETVFPLLQ